MLADQVAQFLQRLLFRGTNQDRNNPGFRGCYLDKRQLNLEGVLVTVGGWETDCAGHLLPQNGCHFFIYFNLA